MKSLLFLTVLVFLIGTYSVGSNIHAFAFQLFPPSTHSNKLTSSPSFIITNQSELRFQPWGRNNTLTIEHSANNGFQNFKFNGATGNTSSGFVSQDLNFSGKKVTFSLTNFTKSPADTQVSFTFIIGARSGHAGILTYTVGPLRTTGWYNDRLYQSLIPGSNSTINLEGLTSQDSHYLKKIVVTVQRGTRINNADLGIKIE